MRGIAISAILVLVFAQIASAAQTLTVNGEALDAVTLKTGQSFTVEVVSDNSNPYSVYIGFDNSAVLGSFLHQQTMPEAGDLGAATEYSVPEFYGYFVTAAGSSPSPAAGVHFVFNYNPSTVGIATLKLYDSTLTVLLDSVEIKVLESEIGSAITYQGKLMESDDVADGLYDLRFLLYDSPSNGNLIGSTVEANDLDIVDGYFTVDLDFGNPEAFYGEGRWLEIGVRPWNLSDPNGYTVLSPRQRIAATPHALGLRGVYVDSDERVGIGTTTPTQNMIVQDARPRIGLVEDGGNAAMLEFHEQENQLRLQHWTDYGSTWNKDLMILDGDTGHVGIGTTNPHQKLHIMDGGIAFTDSVNPVDERLLYLGITGIGPDRRGYKFSWRNDDRSLRSDAMILDRTGDVYFMGGNVGIGTPSPLYDLHINDSADAFVKTESASGEAFFVADGSSNSGLKIQKDGTARAYVYWNSANDFLSLNDAGEDRLVVRFGRVGIGISYPLAKLDVVGGPTGITGISAVANRHGVYGKSVGTSHYGVYGESDSGYGGVYGRSSHGVGVEGESTYGWGVAGFSSSKQGVYGNSSSGHGVEGYSYSSSGVYGSSAHGYAGYFDGDVYVVDNVSALSFTDRTPYPKDLTTAYEAVMSMERLPDGQYDENNKESQLNHSMLSDFVRSEDGNRDLSATVSCLNEVVKDLVRKQEELGKAHTYIEQLQKQNELLEARLVKLEAMIENKPLK